ncbi:spore coat protein CotH, partial [Bacillus anthracis]|nr:spore coat protein CotH [Bacillus anthracis]
MSDIKKETEKGTSTIKKRVAEERINKGKKEEKEEKKRKKKKERRKKKKREK